MEFLFSHTLGIFKKRFACAHRAQNIVTDPVR